MSRSGKQDGTVGRVGSAARGGAKGKKSSETGRRSASAKSEQDPRGANALKATAKASGKGWASEEATDRAAEQHTQSFYETALKQAKSEREREKVRAERSEEVKAQHDQRDLLRSNRSNTQRGFAVLSTIAIIGAAAGVALLLKNSDLADKALDVFSGD